MLIITVVQFKDAPVDAPAVAEFREEGGTIGRSQECTLLLPDPDRIISRTHAVVSHQGGRFFLRDQGTTVPVLLNGRPVGKGREHPLAAGDELRIAGYTMRVTSARADIIADDTTMILREGAMLSWTEDGRPVAQDRIATIIVPEPDGAESPGHLPAASPVPQPAPAAAAAPGAAAAAQDPLLAALLRGAGVQDLAIPGGLKPSSCAMSVRSCARPCRRQNVPALNRACGALRFLQAARVPSQSARFQCRYVPVPLCPEKFRAF